MPSIGPGTSCPEVGTAGLSVAGRKSMCQKRKAVVFRMIGLARSSGLGSGVTVHVSGRGTKSRAVPPPQGLN